MGMAASQARFLSLTARKSNVEYEGQQINQERTALANESSNLYSQLSKMDVPTPPNTSDFYKTVYTFNAKEISGTSTQYTLEDVRNTPEGSKAILSYKEPYFGAVVGFNGSANIIDGLTEAELNDEQKKLYAGKNLTGMAIRLPDASSYQIFKADAKDYSETLKCLAKENPEIYGGYFDANGDVIEGKELLYYEVGDNKQPVFLSPDIEEGNTTNVSYKVIEENTVKTEEFDVTSYTTNDLGRTTSVTIVTGGTDDKPITTTYELECTTVQDEEAYAQAMMDYEYEQAKYERSVADLNAKTEQIQEKDKTLELELKQLDTEQNAISTEMDAVTKVVEDNIESTFKTFA